jgi:predicted glycosyltransferase
LTSKQSTLLGTIARELIKQGYEVLPTCREYEFTVGAFKRLGIDPRVVGKYSEGDPYDKVLADVERMMKLLPVIKKEKPEILISYPNPSAARIAFGLGLKYLAMTDSPHAVIPSRLSLPLADHIIYPSCIPRDEMEKYSYQPTCLVPYDGVDEITWIVRSRPSLKYIKDVLGLPPEEYVVIRPHESHATYYKNTKPGVTLVELINEVISEGYTVVLLPRYQEHTIMAKKLVAKGVNLKLITGMYDGVSLTYYARAVITGGSTLAREAALLMTTGITYFPRRLYVNDFVKNKGYPLYKATNLQEIINILRASTHRKLSYDDLITKLKRDFKDPLEVLGNILRRLNG